MPIFLKNGEKPKMVVGRNPKKGRGRKMGYAIRRKNGMKSIFFEIV